MMARIEAFGWRVGAAHSRRGASVAAALTALGIVWPAVGGAAPAPKAEIQINLCGEPRQITQALHLEAGRGKQRTVWYFDTLALALFERGLVFRLRTDADGAELTLKHADQDCSKVDPDLLPAGAGKCEFDMHGADMKGAVSLNRTLTVAAARELSAGQASLARMLSEGQLRYLSADARLWPLPDGLRVWGPVRLQSYRVRDGDFAVDLWELPDGKRYAEASRKVPATEVKAQRAALERVLAQAGASVCADQSSQAADKLKRLIGRP
jgi:hypothetical protein